MANKVYVLYLLLPLTTVIARQDTISASGVNDQDLANDKVTSILIQPGPAGPRHVILSDEHELFSTHPLREDVASNNFIVSKVGAGHTAAPPRLVTYGPASQVSWRSHPRQQPQQLYHHRFAHDRYQPVEKIPHSKLNKEESKTYPDTISKYASFTKHAKPNHSKSHLGVKNYASRNYENSDFSVTVPERDYRRRPQYDEGYDYQENFHDDEEAKFRESIGEFGGYGSKESDYSSEKKYRPPPPKHYSKHKNAHNENKYYSPVKNYQSYDSHDDEEPYHDSPSGFDDTNGGHVVPLVARFYKQPLPIIQTQLPVDNTGLYVQYVYPHHTAAYDHEQVTNNYYDYPQRRSASDAERSIYPSESEWIPINAPVGSVPARSYDIPAPDLSHKNKKDVLQGKLVSRELDSSSVVVGKMKSPVGLKLNHHLSENSEGVVSAVVRVKQ